MKRLTTPILVVAWLLAAFAAPPVASAAELSDATTMTCAVPGVQDEDDCDEFDFDFDIDFNEDGDIEIDITICKIKEKRTTITTVVVETDEGTEITTTTVVECDYGQCGVEEL